MYIKHQRAFFPKILNKALNQTAPKMTTVIVSLLQN